MDKNRVDGAAKQASGWAKETVGKATGDLGLEGRGATEKAAGKTQRGFGRFVDAIRNILRR